MVAAPSAAAPQAALGAASRIGSWRNPLPGGRIVLEVFLARPDELDRTACLPRERHRLGDDVPLQPGSPAGLR